MLAAGIVAGAVVPPAAVSGSGMPVAL